MLPLPSTPPSVPPPSGYRPTLAADAVRSVSPLRALEPPAAISKERSRAENQTPEGVVVSPGVMRLQRLATRSEAVDSLGVRADSAPVAAEASAANRPPAEKTEIQKALDLQIRDLLVNVWKASAKAVDFLLNRQELAAGQAELAAQPAGPSSGAPGGKKTAARSTSSLLTDRTDSSTQQAIQSYTASGSASSEVGRGTGRIVNLSA